jgi:hypothetical protein
MNPRKKICNVGPALLCAGIAPADSTTLTPAALNSQQLIPHPPCDLDGEMKWVGAPLRPTRRNMDGALTKPATQCRHRR